ncbi:MAG: glutamine-hydrolyzing carbamoyl-phosphate synthase small subunit [Tumebacillaceae bacterium]
MRARLILEDGTVYSGDAFGTSGETMGEIVFNTGMTGYQEVLTDPSYCGQIVMMTYPLIGNYGFHADHQESAKPQVRGFIVREHAMQPNHWKNGGSADAYLKQHGIIGIAGLDTRALTKKIRQIGHLGGVITTSDLPAETYVERMRNGEHRQCKPVFQVTTKTVQHYPGTTHRVVAINYGMKQGILNALLSRGLEVIVVPATTTAEQVMSMQPHGVFLSNGPGDPEELPELVQEVRALLGKVPVFGICLGHQLIALACGARTERLPFGHRGVNHPVQDLRTGLCLITSQNHGYVVDEKSLAGSGLEVTHINSNDRSVEGLRHTQHPCFSVQYHPEARPGPTDSDVLFDRFVEMMDVFWREKHDIAI